MEPSARLEALVGPRYLYATAGKSDGSTVGPITPGNSVIGNVASAGLRLVYTYDPTHATLIVGKPAENIVTQFASGDPTDIIFANGFE